MEHESSEMGGWNKIGLEEKGVKEAEKAASNLPKDLYGIATSDLERAVETAEVIKKRTGIPILEKTPSLRSWNMGKYAGQNPEKIEPILEHLAQKEPDRSTEDGESFNAYKRRFLKGVEAILNKYKGKNIGIITHSHGTRILRAWAKKGCPSDLSLDMKSYAERPLENGGVEEATVPL